MFQTYLQGVVLGLPLMFLTGPVLLTLLQASVGTGRRAGLSVAFGIIVSDLVLVILSYLGVSQLLTTGPLKRWVFLGGGVVVILFGAVSIFKAPVEPTLEESTETTALAGFFLQGVLVNGVNPFVLLFWTGTMSGAIAKLGPSPLAVGWFFGGTLTVIFASDVLKALLAHRLKQSLTRKTLSVINKIAGIGLVGFGVYLVAQIFLKSS